MKHNFTSRKIIGSLFFPILICLIFGTSFVIFSIGKELNALRLGCLFSTLLGGFLPIVITLITKTDTSFYLKDRAIVSAISLVFIFIACLLNELLDSIYYAWCAIFLFVILSTFYFLRKCRTGLERLIVIISNPILYIAVCLVVEWPAREAAVLMLAPFAMIFVIKEWRAQWKVICFRILASITHLRRILIVYE